MKKLFFTKNKIVSFSSWFMQIVLPDTITLYSFEEEWHFVVEVRREDSSQETASIAGKTNLQEDAWNDSREPRRDWRRLSVYIRWGDKKTLFRRRSVFCFFLRKKGIHRIKARWEERVSSWRRKNEPLEDHHEEQTSCHPLHLLLTWEMPASFFLIYNSCFDFLFFVFSYVSLGRFHLQRCFVFLAVPSSFFRSWDSFFFFL